MSVLTVRIPDELEKELEKFCKHENCSKSSLVKKALQEKLEDWQDLRDGLKALDAHRKNPKITSHQTLIAELGLTDKDLQ